MTHQWLGAVGAVLLVLVAAAPYVHSGTEAPAARPAGEAGGWERVGRQGVETLAAASDATRGLVEGAWSLARQRSREAWSRTRVASRAVLHALRDEAARAAGAAGQRAGQVWRHVRDESARFRQGLPGRTGDAMAFVRREVRQIRNTAREAALAWRRNPEEESAGAD